MRVSEIAGIKLEDIETERGWVKVMGKGSSVPYRVYLHFSSHSLDIES
jgi:site-specific recombinase XerC